MLNKIRWYLSNNNQDIGTINMDNKYSRSLMKLGAGLSRGFLFRMTGLAPGRLQ